MDLAGLKEKATEYLWGDAWTEKGRHIRWSVTLLRLAAAVSRDLNEGGLRLRATSLVYRTLLSLVPLLALSFSVLKGFGIHNQMEPFLLHLFQPLGKDAPDIAARIISFVEHVDVGVLGAVGLAVLVYGVVGMMEEIEAAFNDIWRVARRRPLLLRVRDYLSLLLIGPFLMFVSLAITAGVRHAALLEPWLGEKAVGPAATFFGIFAAWLLFVLSFSALYLFMPYTRVRPGPALIAGMVTAAMWKLLGWLFGVFVAGSAGYAAVYSAFAALILFVIWLYVGWLTVLVGASLCYYLQNPSNQRLSRRHRHFSARFRERTALNICAEVGRLFYAGAPAPDTVQIAVKLAVPVMAVEDIAADLLKSGILAGTGPGLRQMIPGRPFDETSVDDMLNVVSSAGEDLNPGALGAAETAIRIQAEAQRKVLGAFTLKQLAGGTA